MPSQPSNPHFNSPKEICSDKAVPVLCGMSLRLTQLSAYINFHAFVLYVLPAKGLGICVSCDQAGCSCFMEKPNRGISATHEPSSRPTRPDDSTLRQPNSRFWSTSCSLAQIMICVASSDILRVLLYGTLTSSGSL
jgi:hypothetical protein